MPFSLQQFQVEQATKGDTFLKWFHVFEWRLFCSMMIEYHLYKEKYQKNIVLCRKLDKLNYSQTGCSLASNIVNNADLKKLLRQ
jgi:hypothetical protein